MFCYLHIESTKSIEERIKVVSNKPNPPKRTRDSPIIGELKKLRTKSITLLTVRRNLLPEVPDELDVPLSYGKIGLRKRRPMSNK
jgi:hypothetical protein